MSDDKNFEGLRFFDAQGNQMPGSKQFKEGESIDDYLGDGVTAPFHKGVWVVEVSGFSKKEEYATKLFPQGSYRMKRFYRKS